jgi:hypothetical protein
MIEPNTNTVNAYHAISQTIFALARGIDRCDRDLLTTCFWPDATDDHGAYKGAASGFIDWVLVLLDDQYEHTQHQITNVRVEFDGDTAYSESCFQAYHRQVSTIEPRDLIASGRYLDRFQRRDNEWRIAHRQVVCDWITYLPSTDQAFDAAPLKGNVLRGKRGRSDASYLMAH